ncbi:2-succinyl-5-enolpyruvyl-6-hydroxy-3-cyclohexene-1-carboxylic-acid synthase [Priestia megaterium]|uniref:2-succinyl-5-enolpyruvyl-6-hydroxy-3- cyclohexene-1-carboxylic-acid synthase n=1 Tax=Priestia megaterium TaxID=1404 RepID=UPI00221FD665|nr:2-succinyl-5-enolpyruvyl-6-hydroxy-3-cyclohexene-1-carboxylic-acid synthase [Priestia megaterium]
MEHIKSLTTYIASFVDELVEANVEEVVVSPGSRSTPIAMLMAEHPNIHVHLNIDERSAGFFALGIAKAKKKPVALVCTSGTAAANYYPAVIEAHYSRIPLVVITADRPHELRDIGAPQAINQNHLFGQYAKWFVDTALPEESADMNRYIRTVASRAVHTAQAIPSGPVHINVPLREPIVPDLSIEDLWSQGKRGKSYVSAIHGEASLSEKGFEEIAKRLEGTTKGLIICGDQMSLKAVDSVCRLAESLSFPVLADPLSQLRSGKHSKENVIETYDTFLKSDKVDERFYPEVVIRFGAMPVSKPLLQFLKAHEPTEMFVVDQGKGWRDPTLRSTVMIEADETLFCEELIKRLSANQEESTLWLSLWKKINAQTVQALRTLTSGQEWFEGQVVQEIVDVVPEGTALFAGNSMPVRDIDSFFLNTEKEIPLFVNRGANGIDGVVSSALGVSTAYDHSVLFIGDLSFYHDLNGLLAAKMHNLNLTVVLVNNDGGGIFSFLPQSKQEKHFEFLFGTPTGLNFEHATRLYDGTFSSASSWEEFRHAMNHAFAKGGLHVVEIRTTRTENVETHRSLWKLVSEEINLSNGEE